MVDNLTITVTLGDAGSAIQDGGIVRMTGTTDDGRQVVWAGDTRIVADLLQALMLGDEDEITVVLEDWQILSIAEPTITATTDEMLDLMMHLDNGTNMFGSLTLDARARIFALVDNPTEETWTNAFGIIVSGTDPNTMPTTLWSALNRHTTYQVVGRQTDKPWPKIPTREQILTALKEELS